MKLIAHRSGPVSFPEQTIQSAREALSLGADMVEIDVRQTSDGVIAISHDLNVSRVFGTDDEVCRMTGEKFLALRHAKDASFGSHLLEDYLRCGVKPLLIHIKERQLIGDMLFLLKKYRYTDQVVLGVQHVESVHQIRAFDPSIRILSFGGSPDDVPAYIEAGVDYIRLWEGWLTPERVQQVKNSPSGLWVMSGCTDGCPVGEPTAENLRKIAVFEPDGILVNDVRFAKEVLK